MTARESSWFLNTHAGSFAKLRLFCFPYAGGGASVFSSWKRELPAHIHVCPVQLPGRERRMLEDPMDSVEAIVHSLVSEITPFLHTPFAFFGHSMGALIAFETARQLHFKHHVTPLHLFVSGKTAPHLPYPRKSLHKLPDDQFKKELQLMQGTPEEVLQNDELMEIVMPHLRADFTAVETYVYRPGEVLPCPIAVFGGLQDHDVSIESLYAWQEHTNGSFQVQMLEGNHFFLHNQEQEVIGSVLRELSPQMRGVAASGPVAR
ncbi:thioesterase II family protein [Paenibacillus algorifonticola]|nr:alpha/beta fold hydrolase [Paenibacillus algorifonticola]